MKSLHTATLTLNSTLKPRPSASHAIGGRLAKRLLRHTAALLFLTSALSGVAAATTLYTTDPIYNIAGDGHQDDSAGLQSAFNAAASANATLSISGTIRTTKNLFLYGNCNIVGSGSTSVILCDADLDVTDQGRLYWISLGITNTSINWTPPRLRDGTDVTHSSHPGTNGTKQCFTGTISNLCIKASAQAKFNRALFTFSTTNLTISNVLFDFTSGTSVPGEILFGPIATGYSGTWAPAGNAYLQNINILSNTINTRDNQTDSEGISVSSATNVLIGNNCVYNVGDDPIALHGVTTGTVFSNTCTSLDGRILVTNSSTINIHDNHCERVPAFDGTTWYGNGAMIMASLEGSSTSAPAPSHITIKNNVIVLPLGVPTYTYGIRIRGGIDVDIASNRLIMSATGGGGGIRVEDDNSIPNWVGSNTSVITGGVAKPQTITIENNICEGTYPGSIEESGTVDTLPGPYVVKQNTAGGYFWYTSGTEVDSTNLLANGDYSAFKVPLSSMVDTEQLSSDNLKNLKANILTSGTMVYSATRAGRIMGFAPQFASLPTSGWINVKLYKNSGTAPISVSTISTNQPVVLDRTNPAFAFQPGDTFRLKAIGSSNLQPLSGVNLPISLLGIESDLSLLYAFDGTSPIDDTVGYDASGNKNSGTATNCMLFPGGVHDRSLSVTGTSEISVPHKEPLSISDNLTVSFWINPSDYPDGYAGHILYKSTNTTDSNFDCYYFGPTNSDLLGKMVFIANAGGQWTDISPVYVLPLHQWAHVALVYTSTSGGQLYINGAPSGTSVGGGTLATNLQPLKIGTGIKGEIDQMRIYRRALSADEIMSLYTLKE